MQVPSGLSRVVQLPETDGISVVLLEQVITRNIDKLFPGRKVLCCHPYRITRNADFSLDEDEVEDLLKETMQFRPESALRAVWETVLAPAAPDREAAGSAYRELLARLAGIDRVARGGEERGEKDAGTPDC